MINLLILINNNNEKNQTIKYTTTYTKYVYKINFQYFWMFMLETYLLSSQEYASLIGNLVFLKVNGKIIPTGKY